MDRLSSLSSIKHPIHSTPESKHHKLPAQSLSLPRFYPLFLKKMHIPPHLDFLSSSDPTSVHSQRKTPASHYRWSQRSLLRTTGHPATQGARHILCLSRNPAINKSYSPHRPHSHIRFPLSIWSYKYPPGSVNRQCTPRTPVSLYMYPPIHPVLCLQIHKNGDLLKRQVPRSLPVLKNRFRTLPNTQRSYSFLRSRINLLP